MKGHGFGDDWYPEGTAAPFVDEPKNYGIGIEVDLGPADIYGVFHETVTNLAKAACRYQDEEMAHALEWHKDAAEHPQCRRCNPPPPLTPEERGPGCQTWTEGDVSVTLHVAQCTCHDDCYDQDY